MWAKRFSFDRCFCSEEDGRNSNSGDGQEKVIEEERERESERDVRGRAPGAEWFWLGRNAEIIGHKGG